MDKKKDEHSQKDHNRKTPALELLTAAIGFILVIGTIGFLLYDALTENDSPPQIAIEKSEIIPLTNGYLVKFQIENKGDNHGADVQIEGKLMEGETEKETSTVSFAYAPSHSKRTGGMFFTENPDKFKLELRALGYVEP